ncbi:MAG TPA: zinc ribbon domain-containing protein [bacterium]|nr:zinc ribbon domain-containing protein [bacterium]
MPTYEYRCQQCGHQFEAFQYITAEPLATCPECGGGVKRLIGAGAGLIFKGSGFYITDYKKSGNGKKEKTGSPDGVSGDKKTETPKPEAKASGS